MEDIPKWAIWAFALLGGSAFVWKMVDKYLPQLIDAAGDALLKIPRVKEFVHANKEKIKKVLSMIRTEVDKDIDEA